MSKSDAWKSWEGRVVDGKYPLRQWLGGSDHSAVFLTEMPDGSGKRAAIKLTEADSPDAEREISRLRSAAKLNHPNLISIYDCGRFRLDSTPVIHVVMECAEEDLGQILPQRPLTSAEVSDMLSPLLEALSYLHESGFVHSRLKPSNVLAVGEQLKLSTDQAVKAGEPIPMRRSVGVYDAPETATGNISRAGDIWSLGVTIVTALTQNAPGFPSKKGAVAGSLPEPFRSITRDCLNIDPQQRCSLEDIRERLRPTPKFVPAETKPLKISDHASQRDASKLPAFAIPLVLVVVALAAWGLFHSRKSSPNAPADLSSQQTQKPAAQPLPKPTAAKPEADRASGKRPPEGPSPRATGVPANAASAAGGSVLHQVLPDIPQSAKNTIHGTIKVVVWVDVDPTGKVMAAKFKSAGPSRYFAGKAMKAAEGWKFAAPQSDGQPRTSAWLVTFRFRRKSVDASPQRVAR